MAFIYEYHLRDKNERIQYRLNDYSTEFGNILTETFSDNLKEYDITEETVKFKLYISVPVEQLRSLGKIIKKRVLYTDYGFIRKDMKLYAIVESVDKESNTISLEFIDSGIDKVEEFIDKAEQYSRHNDLLQHSNEIRRYYYADVYSGEMDYDAFRSLCNTQEISVGDSFFISVTHRRMFEISEGEYKERQQENALIKLDDFVDYRYLSIKKGIVDEMRYDFFHIRTISAESKEEFQQKISIFSFDKFNENLRIDEEEDTMFPNVDEGRIVDFCVHNVGQALATSFAYENETPFLYFDYGLPHGRNKHTMPVNVQLNVNSQTKIYLSHMHKDHWIGLNKFMDAFKCSWYVPNQTSLIFEHRRAEIIVAGGNVKKIIRSKNNGIFEISCSETSRVDSSRIPEDMHETGLAFCVNATDITGKKYKILIEGDQDYDYIINNFLDNINCLVACHHGGRYSWTTRAKLPYPDTNDNHIIYSYGEDNTYKHPSKVSEYRKSGWNNEFHTAYTGDFIKKIFLRS